MEMSNDCGSPLCGPGKLPPELLSRSVLRWTGAERGDLLVGGGLGEDAAVVRWPSGSPYLAAASDPITGASEGAGALLVHVNANDVACKGADPAWFLATLILPVREGAALAERLMREIHGACAELGAAVAGGHTELTDRWDRPILSGTMLGPSRRLLSAGNIRPGDQILVTGHAGLEGMTILAKDRPDLLSFLEPGEVEEVRGWGLSVVAAARTLRDFARYLHDPTEGGLEGALLETAQACGLGVELDRDRVPVSPLTRRAAAALGFDPLRLISSGMLMAAVEDAAPAQEALSRAGIASQVIGRFTGGPVQGLEAREELWGLLAR